MPPEHNEKESNKNIELDISQNETQMSEKHLKRFNIVSHHVSENCSYFEISLYPNQNDQDKKNQTKANYNIYRQECGWLFTACGSSNWCIQ